MQLRLSTLMVVPLSFFLVGCGEKKTTADSDSVPVQSKATMAEVDNSGKNVRDRNGATLTAGDQGGSDADREITQKIRQACVSGANDYSTTAKNIKIITLNGKVTLRGPVKTDAEKTGIVLLAKNVAGDSNVEDQLEVKSNN